MSGFEEHEYGYKVDLEVFSGPLDLLLYLIRQDEVEIEAISVARITDQYLEHIEALQAINVNLAGEFVLMAATLMEMKSRALLPRPETAEEEEEDPRADLIRQLIEYKKFKDAARGLAARADEQALKFPRGAAAALGLPERGHDEDLPILLGEVSVWNLVAAFQAILRQTKFDSTRHIVLDEKPAVAYCNDLLGLLRGRERATFRELFDPSVDRVHLISAFLALLELIRRRRVRVEQAGSHGEIHILLLDDTPVAEVELAEAQPPPPPPQAEAEAPAPGGDAEAELEDAELDAIVVPDVVAAFPETDEEEAPAATPMPFVPPVAAPRQALRGRGWMPRRPPPVSLLADFPRRRPRRRRPRVTGVVYPRH